MQSDRASLTSCHPVAELKRDLLRTLPKLRAYARSLCRSTEYADDLVQEALVKALANIDSFEPGSNMIGWLCTILRNGFYSEYRKRRNEVEDDEGRYAAMSQISASQEEHIYFLNVRDALNRLTAEHREALMLIVSGLSYDEAAAICGCAAGTMKSRVSRARGRLAQIVADGPPRAGAVDHDPGPRGSRQIDISSGAVAFG